MSTQVEGAIYFVQNLANQLGPRFTSKYLTGFNIKKAALEWEIRQKNVWPAGLCRRRHKKRQK